MSSRTYSLGLESIFDRYSSIMDSGHSDLSFSEGSALRSMQERYPRTPFADHDLYVDSRGLATEIIRRLRSELGSMPVRRNGLAINGDDLSANLRQILECFCAEIQGTDQQDTQSPRSIQNPLHQKVHSMILKEIPFLIESLVYILQKNLDLLIVEILDVGRASAGNKGKETVSFVAVLDFLIGGKAFGRLRFRTRRVFQRDIMETISREALLSLSSRFGRRETATFHVRWELFDHILCEQDGSTDISQVLTITGEGRNAFASRCADYLKWLWKDSKYDICSHIQQYLEHKSYSKS